MNEKPKFMTHERIMAGEEYVSYSDYLMLQRERDDARAEWGKASMDAAQLLSEKTKVIAERDELLDILRKLLEIIPEPECHDFGHTKEERHAFLEECPVMARYDALIAQATEAVK